MNPRSLLRFARPLYRAVPLLAVRKLMYDTFARAVRHRHTVTTIDGLTFDLDLGEIIDLSLYLHEWEPDVTGAIARFTRPGMTILDIGANIGAHTLSFAKLTGSGGRVVAFEPTNFAFAKLQRNLSLNSFTNVEPVKIALSDAPAPEQEVNFRASWRTDGTRKEGPSTVAFERLDDWAAKHALSHVDLIKIDVDGNEFPLLAGGRELIARSKPLMLMEVVGPHFDDPNRNPFALLRELGYRFWPLLEEAEVTIEEMAARLPKHDVGMTISFNLVASLEPPPGKRARESKKA